MTLLTLHNVDMSIVILSMLIEESTMLSDGATKSKETAEIKK